MPQFPDKSELDLFYKSSNKCIKYQTKQHMLGIVLVTADHVKTAECTVLLRTYVNTAQSAH